MSAIEDPADGPTPPVQVLFALHPGFDTLDVTGALEIFSWARHSIKDASTKAFTTSFVADAEHTVSVQGASLRAHMDFEDAHDSIRDYDVLVIPGGSEETVLASEAAEPMGLIRAFADLQQKDTSKERTIIALSGGAMFLAEAGALQGMAATTHPDLYTKFELACQRAARRGDLEQTDVMEERYVVNNARFALGDDEEDNPFVFRKRPAASKSRTVARKGSNAWKESNRRRESAALRAKMRLGGLRVITSGGGTAALDASLYLVSAMVSHESAEEIARILQYQWNKGVVVDSIDV